MGNFTTDLSFGKKWEHLAQRLLGENVVEVADGCFKDWDFRTANASYEVKADRYAHRTNCCFIEYECNGKPSGITASKADYYMYFAVKPNNEYDVYKIPTDAIREACKKPLATKSGGDNYKVKGHIVSLQDFKDYKFTPNPM